MAATERYTELIADLATNCPLSSRQSVFRLASIARMQQKGSIGLQIKVGETRAQIARKRRRDRVA
jgi:hypothetical protein